MLSSVTTIRNLFILLAALALATGCTTAKTLGTPVSAVEATPAPSSDTGAAEVAEAPTDTGTAEAVEATTDTGTAEAVEATTDTGTTEAVEATSDTAEPSVETGVAEAAEPATPETWTPSPLTLWVVHKGEHLWGISAHDKVYGDPYQWPLLFKRNRHQIADADLIYPGQVLHIERDLSNVEIDRAIEHAKTRGAWILGITELTDLEYLSRERAYE